MTLIERIRFRLHMLWAGLTTKPIAGAEEGGEGGGEPQGKGKEGGEPAEPKGGQEPSKGQKPPWGDDEKFDPQRAWKLIQDVRGDAEKAKTEREELAAKVKMFEDRDKSEGDKLKDRADKAETDAKEAKAEVARLRVGLRKGLTETQAKRLVGDDEETLEKDADELLASFKGEGDEARRRPQERLRPGAAPSSDPEETDPIKLAEKVPRMY